LIRLFLVQWESQTKKLFALSAPGAREDKKEKKTMTQEIILNLTDEQESILHAGLETLTIEKILPRIWEHDHTVWKPEPTEITNRLDWLQTAAEMRSEIPRMKALRDDLLDEGYTDVLLLGMGGSSLAPEVFARTFDDADGLSLTVLDSTDPRAVLAHTESLDLSKTMFVVATKSGSTVETLSFFKYCFNRVAAALGRERAGEHFVAVTDPGSKLIDLADEHHFRATLTNNPNIGGRYSVLSFFGLFAATLVGIDVARLLDRAQEMANRCSAEVTVEKNPAARIGATMGKLAQGGRNKITFVASDSIADFPNWVEQLIAESTGKEGVGILPVVGEPLGEPDVYGDDRIFVYLQVGADDTHLEALDALHQAGHPLIRCQLRDRYDLGGQYFLWELATAIGGYFLEINPFNQPNVESAKVRAKEMVTAYKQNGSLPEGESTPPSGEALDSFVADTVARGGYIALQAYVQPTDEVEAALQQIRLKLRDRYKMATTLGFGPRFLHSTGQLHKGDSGEGVFVQFISTAPQDVAIPNQAGELDSSISFDTLKKAQALGDAQALRDAGRRVISFPLGKDVLATLETLSRELG
jgi:glucose-6-phosphate isomerase